MSDFIKDYNSPEERKKRMEQEDPIIMYLVVHEIGMSAGKIAAQAGHAVHMCNIKHREFSKENAKLPFPEVEDKLKTWDVWENNSFRKVTLTANDNKWAKLKEKLKELKIEHVLVIDSGLTEIPYGSETVIGVWPMHKSAAPQVIKKLQTLK